MNVEFIDIVLIVLFFQLVSIAPFLLFQRRPNSIANQILGVFVLAKALCISNLISFRLFSYTHQYCPHLFFVGSSFTLLWGPLLYFYTKAMTCKAFKFGKPDMLHFLPFLAHIAYMSIHFHFHSVAKKRALLSSGHAVPEVVITLYHIYLFTSLFVYTAMAFYLVWSYRIKIKQTLSSLDMQQLSWLLFVLIGFLAKGIFDLWFSLEMIFSKVFMQEPFIASRIILFLFINLLIYKAMKQPQLFAGIPSKNESRKLSLSKSLAAQYAQKLTDYMEKEKPFFNPDITIEDLGELVSIPPRSLSEVINNEFGKNFYDFINGYRIKESQRLLSESKAHKKTVLEVLYDVGFNSKSAFNSSFKKHTGMTPLEFRKMQT